MPLARNQVYLTKITMKKTTTILLIIMLVLTGCTTAPEPIKKNQANVNLESTPSFITE